MLDAELVDPADRETAARIFHRDGFVCLRDALTPEQLRQVRAGAERVIAEQTAAIPLDQANRGFARYSFGNQMHHREWAMLVDLPTVLPVIEAIWPEGGFRCTGGGGDYSLPGAEIQPLHADLPDDLIRDPLGRVTVKDMPTMLLVVNIPTVDFTVENGAIRFVPGTHRSRTRIPSLAEEPRWMRESRLCAPAGTAIVRDVRCWHGGTANRSRQIRPMVSVGYQPAWFAFPHGSMPASLQRTLSPRARELTAGLVAPDAPAAAAATA